MSKDELREEFLDEVESCFDREGECNRYKLGNLISNHVQREVAAFAEQAGQAITDFTFPDDVLLSRQTIRELPAIYKELAQAIRSLAKSPKTFAEMVRDAVLEARIEEAKWRANHWPPLGAMKTASSLVRWIGKRTTENEERIASLEREREARKA